MIGEAPRDDKDAVVKISGLEPGDSEGNEVVSVSSQENTAFRDREAQLLRVRVASAVDFVDGDRIKAETPGDLGYGGVEILIEKEPHRRQELPVTGLRERELGLDPL